MKDAAIILLVEGDTEDIFYRLLMSRFNEMQDRQLSCKYKIVNMKGIGAFKDKAKRIYDYQIKINYPKHDLFIFLCIDSDVFELSKKPPINRTAIKKSLTEKGTTVTYIYARKSIEDWFLYDYEGILNYLHLSRTTKAKGNCGAEKVEYLFKKAGKVYIKGYASRDFIEALNLEKIMFSICNELKVLCRKAGIICDTTKMCKRNG